MRWSLFVILATLVLSSSMASTIRSDSVLNYGSSPYASKLSCSTSDALTTCLKMKSLAFLENLVENDNPIPLFGGTVTVVRSLDVGEELVTGMSDEELPPSLPKDKKLKEAKLDKLISSYTAKFFQSRALQIRLPDMSSWNYSSSIDEGRKKKGGGGWAILMAGGMMGALGIGSLALLAGKALMVSLMALMLSGLVALRKGGGGGGHHDADTYEVINVPTGHGHHRRTFSPFGYSRSLETGFDLPSSYEKDITATELAYRAHVGGLQKNDSNL